MSYELHYSSNDIPKITIRNKENYKELYKMEDACNELNRISKELKKCRKRNVILKKALDDSINIEKVLK